MHTTCMCLWCNWVANCVVALQTKIETQERKKARKNSQNGSNMKWQEPRHIGGGMTVARVHEQRSRNY